MKYLVNDCNDACRNMAFDAFCLESLPLDEPVFCLWRNSPSVIIGLNQNAYTEVDLNYLKTNGIALARRVTGGGAVYHDLNNLNYTIVGRSEDLDRDFPGYLSLVADALRSLGVPAELTGRNDILVEGRKCSGYAKRVYKDRLMVHGTLMFDVDIAAMTAALSAPGSKFSSKGIASVRSKVANLREYLPQFATVLELRDALHSILAGGDGEVQLDAGQQALIEKEAESRYRSWEWIYGRSPEAAFRTSHKFACGTVEAVFDLSHGRIASIRFGGDFIGSLPATALERRLVGCRFEPDAVAAALKGAEGDVRTGDCFDGLTEDDIARLITGNARN